MDRACGPGTWVVGDRSRSRAHGARRTDIVRTPRAQRDGRATVAGTPDKQPNARLTSWFVRSGWSKGELARQVNRRARQLGAHHVSTDTSRVRRWLDGENPREP